MLDASFGFNAWTTAPTSKQSRAQLKDDLGITQQVGALSPFQKAQLNQVAKQNKQGDATDLYLNQMTQQVQDLPGYDVLKQQTAGLTSRQIFGLASNRSIDAQTRVALQNIGDVKKIRARNRANVFKQAFQKSDADQAASAELDKKNRELSRRIALRAAGVDPDSSDSSNAR